MDIVRGEGVSFCLQHMGNSTCVFRHVQFEMAVNRLSRKLELQAVEYLSLELKEKLGKFRSYQHRNDI